MKLDPSRLWCTDEDLFVRDPGNFPDLIPAHQLIASGTDGVIDPSSPWTLTAASATFAGSGVASGSIVVLDAPDDAYASSPSTFAVAEATATTLILRRVGMPAGTGQPPMPGPALSYSIRTSRPQIEEASYDLNRRYGIDDNFFSRSAGYLYDGRALRQATVLMVLVWLYTTMSRESSGDWKAKLDSARSDLESLMGRLSLDWGPLGMAQPSTSRTTTRLVR